MEIYVKEIPPYKQIPADKTEKSLQITRVNILQEIGKMSIKKQLEGPVKLGIRYYRNKGRADAANIIGGIADALNKIAYKDDRQIKKIEYLEQTGNIDEYWIIVEKINGLTKVSF